MKNVYQECPVYGTRSFTLRLVRPSDAADLLSCYADPEAVTRMNADNCAFGFYLPTPEAMRNCIAFWLWEYREGHFVRLAVVSRADGRAVGTVEMFAGDFPGFPRTERWRRSPARSSSAISGRTGSW